MKYVKRMTLMLLLVSFLLLHTIPVIGEEVSGIRLDWYADGNYSHAIGQGSIEQFIAVFSEPVKGGEFQIIIPDRRMNDSWGQGNMGVISQEPGKSMVMGSLSEAYLHVQVDACRRSEGDHANRFIIKLSHDWTEILDTESTGWVYHDDAINQLRLVAKNFEDEQGNRVEELRGTNTIAAYRDVVLHEDTSPPRVIYQEQRVSRLGEFQFYPGTIRFVFHEPVQIRSDVFNRPKTASQYEQQKYAGIHPYMVSYIKIQELDGESVTEEVEVFGDYKGWNCLWRDHTEGKAVGEPVILDVDKWDDETRIRCTRDFGWHWFGPTEVLSPGIWLVRIMGITDQAGNVMDLHEMEVLVEDNDFLTVTEITEEEVVFHFSEPAEMSRNFPVFIEPPFGEDMLLWARVSEGDTESTAHFEVPFDSLPGGEWKINGVTFLTRKRLSN